MAEKIILVNPRIYQIKAINVGTHWDWLLFLFPFLLTIPLLTRQLYQWAFFMLLLSVINASLIYTFIFVMPSWIIIVFLPFTMFIMLVS